ncbi:MAG: PqqD family protein [Elusimicrobiota bacterium]|jgi:hypothetical protein
MGYETLIRKSWLTGDFRVPAGAAEAADHGPTREELRLKVRREMENVIAREAGDAPWCLSAHKEGCMKLAPFVKFREEKFGAVLFETRSEKVYTLSPTGAAVVREIVAGAGSHDLAARLQGKFQDKTGKLAQEAMTFLAELKAKGLITE